MSPLPVFRDFPLDREVVLIMSGYVSSQAWLDTASGIFILLIGVCSFCAYHQVHISEIRWRLKCAQSNFLLCVHRWLATSSVLTVHTQGSMVMYLSSLGLTTKSTQAQTDTQEKQIHKKCVKETISFFHLCAIWAWEFQLTPAVHKMPVRLTAASTLTVGVNVCLNGCLSFSVSLAIDWAPVQGLTCLSPYDRWQTPAQL